MTRRDLKAEFNSYRDISKDNLKSFNLLMEQSKILDKLINDADAEKAEELRLVKEKLDKNIGRLIDNSAKLFTKYKNMITEYSEVA